MNPISNIKYLAPYKPSKGPGSALLGLTVNKYKANNNKTEPCPKSPNITPNKKGKVVTVNNPGLAS